MCRSRPMSVEKNVSHRRSSDTSGSSRDSRYRSQLCAQSLGWMPSSSRWLELRASKKVSLHAHVSVRVRACMCVYVRMHARVFVRAASSAPSR